MIEGSCHCAAVRRSFDDLGRDGRRVKDMWF